MSDMTKEEVEKIIEMMVDKGWHAEICDTPIRHYDCGVKAGYPDDPGDYSGDYILVPANVARSVSYQIDVRGDSMKDAGLDDGDIVTVQAGNYCVNGDIIIALIDGEFTMKTYMEDEHGGIWLVPANKKYDPIFVKQDQDFRVLGKITNVLKVTQRDTERAKEVIASFAKSHPVALTERRIIKAIKAVYNRIEYNRYWFSIFRVLVDRGWYDGIDQIRTFASDVPEWLGNDELKIDAKDLRRLAVQSFAKPYTLWNSSDAPVSGSRYNEYLSIAKEFNRELG